MLFRTLQKWYDLFTYGDGRSAEYRQQREKEYQQWRERQAARERMSDLKHEMKMGRLKKESIDRIEMPDRQFYETADGYHAARLIEQQRYEDGRSKRYRRNLTEAHQQAEDAEQEGWAETLRDAFGDFDEENKQRRIDRLREEIDALTNPRSPDFEAVNARPARGWAMSNGGEAYRQMVQLRAPVLANVENEEFAPVKEVEPEPEIDWRAVNDRSKQVTSAADALEIAAGVEDPEVSDFWLQLAEEYEIDEENQENARD